MNDVITGIILYGIRLYMQDVEYSSRTKRSTLLPMVNTRNVKDYETAKDMQKTKGTGTWGNRFTYIHVSVPKLEDTHISNPLLFVQEVYHAMNRNKRSWVSSLICMLLKTKHKFQGPEVST